MSIRNWATSSEQPPNAPVVLWEAQLKTTYARLRMIPGVTAPGVTLQSLNALPGWRIRPEIRVYGGIKHQQRDVLFASDEVAEYPYSGTAQPANPLTPVTRAALDALNRACPEAKFNALLINRYNGGKQYISWHADDEKTLGAGYCVATWSFGAEREFQVREKASATIVWKGVLPAHSVCVMEGAHFQWLYQHSVPERTRETGMRISVTARRHTPTRCDDV